MASYISREGGVVHRLLAVVLTRLDVVAVQGNDSADSAALGGEAGRDALVLRALARDDFQLHEVAGEQPFNRVQIAALKQMPAGRQACSAVGQEDLYRRIAFGAGAGATERQRQRRDSDQCLPAR